MKLSGNTTERLDAMHRDLMAMNDRTKSSDQKLAGTIEAVHASLKELAHQVERAATPPPPPPPAPAPRRRPPCLAFPSPSACAPGANAGHAGSAACGNGDGRKANSPRPPRANGGNDALAEGKPAPSAWRNASRDCPAFRSRQAGPDRRDGFRSRRADPAPRDRQGKTLLRIRDPRPSRCGGTSSSPGRRGQSRRAERKLTHPALAGTRRDCDGLRTAAPSQTVVPHHLCCRAARHQRGTAL